jgi:hypothetical protein
MVGTSSHEFTLAESCPKAVIPQSWQSEVATQISLTLSDIAKAKRPQKVNIALGNFMLNLRVFAVSLDLTFLT